MNEWWDVAPSNVWFIEAYWAFKKKNRTLKIEEASKTLKQGKEIDALSPTITSTYQTHQ